MPHVRAGVVNTLLIWCCGIAFSASLVMLTRDEEGQLMLSFVSNRRTCTVLFTDVDRIEVVR